MDQDHIKGLNMNTSSTARAQRIINLPVLEPGEHPIEKNRYRLTTHAMECMLNQIFSWIEKATPGAIVYGKPRTGKTESIFEIQSRLPDLLGNDIPIEIFDCANYAGATPRENQFYEDLLGQFGYAIAWKGSKSIKLNRLIDFMCQKSKVLSENRFILFLDEAQCLHEYHFKWLMGIHNRLKKKQVYLIVFLIGQPELLTLRSTFAATAQSQIIGRFMVSAHEFKGVTSYEELEIILGGIDKIEYPQDSGCCYTEFYVPIAYNHGLRLKSYAKLIFNSFLQKLKQETSLETADIEIPMQILPATISYILQELSNNDSKELTLTSNIINDAIDYSDYIDWMRNVVELPINSRLEH